MVPRNNKEVILNNLHNNKEATTLDIALATTLSNNNNNPKDMVLSNNLKVNMMPNNPKGITVLLSKTPMVNRNREATTNNNNKEAILKEACKVAMAPLNKEDTINNKEATTNNKEVTTSNKVAISNPRNNKEATIQDITPNNNLRATTNNLKAMAMVPLKGTMVLPNNLKGIMVPLKDRNLRTLISKACIHVNAMRVMAEMSSIDSVLPR